MPPILRLLLFFLLTAGIAIAQEIKITSPEEAQTFAYGSVATRRLIWKEKEQLLVAEVTFTNDEYSSGGNPAEKDICTFRLPGIRYDEATKQFLAPDTHGQLLPVAERTELFIGSTITPLPQTTIRIIRDHGKARVILESGPAAPPKQK